MPELLWDMSEVLQRIRESILIESCLWVKVLELSLLFTMGMLQRLNMKVTVEIQVSPLLLLRMEQSLANWKLKVTVRVFTHPLMVVKLTKILTKLTTLLGKTRYLFCWLPVQKINLFLTLIAKKFSLELKRLDFLQPILLSMEHTTFHGNKSSLPNTIHPSCKTSLMALILPMLKHLEDVNPNPEYSCNSQDQWSTCHSLKKSLLYQLTNKLPKKTKTKKKQMVELYLLGSSVPSLCLSSYSSWVLSAFWSTRREQMPLSSWELTISMLRDSHSLKERKMRLTLLFWIRDHIKNEPS